MATTEEILNVRYDMMLSEQEQELKSIFSEVLLGLFRKDNKNSFEEIIQTSSLSLRGSRMGGRLRGLNFLKELTFLDLASCLLTDIGDLGGLEKLTHVDLANNNLTDIGRLVNADNLTYLNLYGNSISPLPFWFVNLTSLETLILDRNNSTTFPNLKNSTSLKNLSAADLGVTSIQATLIPFDSLESLNLSGNSINRGNVDAILAEARTAKENSSPLETLDLSGGNTAAPTNGVNNADYQYLINQGVDVTITA